MNGTPRVCSVLSVLVAMAWAIASDATARADSAQDQFAVAAAHYSAHRWQLAADEFATFLEQAPLHAQVAAARFFRAESLVQLREYEPARAELRRYLEQFPKGKYVRQAEYRVGELGYFLSDGKQARADLQGYLRSYPDDPLNAATLAYLGELSLDAGDADFAVRYFRQAIEQFPKSERLVPYQFGLARALEKTGEHAEAGQLFAQLAEGKNDLHGDALFHLAACRYAQGEYPQALADLERFADAFSDRAKEERVCLLKGWIYFQLTRWDEAAECFRRCATSDKVGLEAKYWLGLTQKKTGDWTAGLETLQKAAAEGANSDLMPAIHFHVGDALLALNRPDEADAEFLAVLNATSGPRSEWLNDCTFGRVRCALLRNDLGQVELLASEYERDHPHGIMHREIQRTLAIAYLNAGQPEKAIDVLRPLVAATTDGPKDAEQQLLAQAYQRNGKYQEALELLDQTSTPSSGARLTRGLTLLGLEDYAAALPLLTQYLEDYPTEDQLPHVLAEVAYCQFKLGKTAEAKTTYERLQKDYATSEVFQPATKRLADLALAAGDLDFAERLYGLLRGSHGAPQISDEALFGAGRIAYRRADYVLAANKLAELLETYPSTSFRGDALLLRGAALEKSGDYDAALHLYREVFEKHADSPLASRAKLAAARLHRRAKQTAEAAELYRDLIAHKDSGIQQDLILYELGWLLRDADQADQAAQLFTRLCDEYPESAYWPDATYRLAEQARATGKFDAAVERLNGLIKRGGEQELREYALYLKGQIAAERQQWSLVSAPMQTVLNDYPWGKLAALAQFWLAEALYRQDQREEATREFELLSKNAGDLSEDLQALIWLRIAQIKVQRNDWTAALDLANDLTKRFPKFNQMHEVDYLLGRCLVNEAKFDDARAAYHRVTQSEVAGKSETSAMAQWMIGESYFHQKSYRAAIKEYLRVEILYAFPNWQAAALLQAGKCHELLNEHDAAVELYRRLIKTYPETQFAEEAASRLSLAQQKPSSDARR